jgi:transcriptional regulator with XRE-family HTH domain
VELQADEFEALRLMDFEGLYQEQCAERMGISRTTLSRTVIMARRKVADALLHGKRLVIAQVPAQSLIASSSAAVMESGLSLAAEDRKRRGSEAVASKRQRRRN